MQLFKIKLKKKYFPCIRRARADTDSSDSYSMEKTMVELLVEI